LAVDGASSASSSDDSASSSDSDRFGILRYKQVYTYRHTFLQCILSIGNADNNSKKPCY
jgi:hypothetical protein